MQLLTNEQFNSPENQNRDNAIIGFIPVESDPPPTSERTIPAKELYSLWAFANAQLEILKAKKDKSDNPTENMCLAFAANCIVDIMDEIAEILEPSGATKTLSPTTPIK